MAAKHDATLYPGRSSFSYAVTLWRLDNSQAAAMPAIPVPITAMFIGGVCFRLHAARDSFSA